MEMRTKLLRWSWVVPVLNQSFLFATAGEMGPYIKSYTCTRKQRPPACTPVWLTCPFCAHPVSSEDGEKRRVGGSGHSEAAVLACSCTAPSGDNNVFNESVSCGVLTRNKRLCKSNQSSRAMKQGITIKTHL